MANSNVIHPSHYNGGSKECWDEMVEIFGEEAVAIFDVLNAYKYHYRAGAKDGNSEEQDLAKMENYMHHSADVIANSTSKNMTNARKCYRSMRCILAGGTPSFDED